MNLNKIRKVIAYTDGQGFYPTEQEAIEALKQKEIESIVYNCLNSIFDYDEKYLQEQIAKRLVSRIDEIIEIMEA
ncbi:MAG: hypothetical protein KHZ82_02565 [Peptoniphilus harei]|nr:hypothetical protein [Peptoniphilus harei]